MKSAPVPGFRPASLPNVFLSDELRTDKNQRIRNLIKKFTQAGKKADPVFLIREENQNQGRPVNNLPVVPP